MDMIVMNFEAVSNLIIIFYRPILFIAIQFTWKLLDAFATSEIFDFELKHE